jgi:DNA-binding NarL/FixJ family response regulator
MPEALAAHAPRVAILNFGSLRSAAEVRELHFGHPSTHLVVLGNRPTPAESSQMLSFGATACLSKTTQARDVLNAIHLASRGMHVLPTTRSSRDPRSDEHSMAGPELLTPREADVLDLLQRGRSNAEIAASLHVSVETVRTHARHIYRKLGVRTRRDLRASR